MCFLCFILAVFPQPVFYPVTEDIFIFLREGLPLKHYVQMQLLVLTHCLLLLLLPPTQKAHT